MESLSNQKVQKNKLALKSEMNGSLLFVLFDLKTFLLIKVEHHLKINESLKFLSVGQNIHPC